jgi:ankyrin repeat protein
MLLERGASINTPTVFGRTPLNIASHQGHFEVVPLLLEYGADPNMPDNYSRTPSDIASANGHGRIVELLSEYAAKSIKTVASSL